MEETPAQKILIAFELFDFGLDMQRQKLRRQHPDMSDGEIDSKLTEWLQNPEMAPLGDCEGSPISGDRLSF